MIRESAVEVIKVIQERLVYLKWLLFLVVAYQSCSRKSKQAIYLPGKTVYEKDV